MQHVTLKALGWGEPFESAFLARGKKQEIPARVVEEQRGGFVVQSALGETLATISGRMRHNAPRREDFPAVGDWVAIKAFPEQKTATIQAILPRRSKLSRKASGKETEEQLIAANLDTVFIVTSLNKDFNPRRLERYVAMVAESGARAVVLLSKADLSADPVTAARDLQGTAGGTPIVAVSAVTGMGLEALTPYLRKAETVALIGSSGVGKSTLINKLIGWDRQKVQEVREGDDRGRHTTTCRRLIALPQGALLIDTPGMRELQVWDTPAAPAATAEAFDDILVLIEACRFRNCKHRSDDGCAVQPALADGRLSAARFENFLKLAQESSALAAKIDAEADYKANEKVRLARAAYKRERKRNRH